MKWLKEDGNIEIKPYKVKLRNNMMELVPGFLDGEELQALAGTDWYLVCVQSSFSRRISFRSPGNSSLER